MSWKVLKDLTHGTEDIKYYFYKKVQISQLTSQLSQLLCDMLSVLCDFSLSCYGSRWEGIFQFPHTCWVVHIFFSGQCLSLRAFWSQSHFFSKLTVWIASVLCFWLCQSIYHPNQYDSIFWFCLSSNEHDACASLPCWRVLLKFGRKTARDNPIGQDNEAIKVASKKKRVCLWHSTWYYRFMRRASALSTSIYQDRKHKKSKYEGQMFWHLWHWYKRVKNPFGLQKHIKISRILI